MNKLNEAQDAIIKTMRQCPGSHTTNDIKTLAHAVLCEHRTHQANIVRNLVQILTELGDVNLDYTDLRNKAAMEACKEIKSLDIAIPYV